MLVPAKKSFGVLLWLILTALLAGSCSSDSRSHEAIRIRWAHDPETLDPMMLANQAATDANNLLHLSLLQAEVKQHEYVPALAAALPEVRLIGDSLMHITYELRPLAAWDNGRPVLGSDVAFTVKLMFCPGLPNEMPRTQYRFIKTVLADPANPRRFTIVCRGQAPEYVKATGDFFVLSAAALDPAGSLGRFTLAELQRRASAAPADTALQALARHYQQGYAGRAPGHLPGCGPYQLVRWEKDRFLTFRRKARWWADQLRPVPRMLQAKPRQLEYVIIPDVATATLALRRGDLDVFPQMPAREFERLRAAPATRTALNFYTTTSYDVVTAGFNTSRPALADALTRRALSYCFDADNLLKATQLGAGQRTAGLISPCDTANYNDKLLLGRFDPSRAAALLRLAGWQRVAAPTAGWFRPGAGGTRPQLRLALRYRASDPLFATIALQFQAATAPLDIPVSLLPTESGAFSEAVRAGDFDLYVRVLKGNPFMFNFTPLLHSQGIGAGNSTRFSTPASDHLIEAIAAASSTAARQRLLRQFQALMQQEMPMVPLFFLPSRTAADKHLRGLNVGSLKPGYLATTIERTAQAALAP